MHGERATERKSGKKEESEKRKNKHVIKKEKRSTSNCWAEWHPVGWGRTRSAHLIRLETQTEPGCWLQVEERSAVSPLNNNLLSVWQRKHKLSSLWPKHANHLLTFVQNSPLWGLWAWVRLTWLSQMPPREMSVCLHWCVSHKHLTDRSDMLTGLCTADTHPWAISGWLQFWL